MTILIDQLQQRISYVFSDSELLELALSHRSFGAHNNERLEFLGDSALGFIIGEALYLRFPEAREGLLSRMRSQLVKGETLADIASEYRVGECLRLGAGEVKSGGHRRASILADTLEAIIGAVYLDAGYHAAKCFVLALYDSRLDKLVPEVLEKDAKTRLQEYLQAKQQPLPIYTLMSSEGAEHQQQFTVECAISSMDLSFMGTGSSRKKAEQIAADAAFRSIESNRQ